MESPRQQNEDSLPLSSEQLPEMALCKEFMGPSCLYKLLNERMQKNKLFLPRNLRRKVKSNDTSKSSVTINGQTTFHFDPAQHHHINSVSIFMVMRHDSEYHILPGKHFEVVVADSVETSLDFNAKFKFNLEEKHIAQSNCLFLVLLASKYKNSLNHRKMMENLMLKFAEREAMIRRSKMKAVGEDISFVSLFESKETLDSVRYVLVDISPHLESLRRKLQLPQVVTLSSVYRLFMDPLYFQPISGVLRETQTCRVFHGEILRDYDEAGEIPYDITVDSLINVQSMNSPLRLNNAPSSSSFYSMLQQSFQTPHSSQIQNQSSSSTSSSSHPTVQRHENNAKLTFHYHVVNSEGDETIVKQNQTSQYENSGNTTSKRLPPKHYIWQESRDHFACPWCPSFHAHGAVPISIDPVTKRPTPDTLEALCALGQHLQSFHFHFQYDFGLDSTGNIHILMTRDRSSVIASAPSLRPTVYSGKKRKFVVAHPSKREEFQQFHAKRIQVMNLLNEESFLSAVNRRSKRPTTTDSFVNMGEQTANKTKSSSTSADTKLASANSRANKTKSKDPRLQESMYYGRPNRLGYFHPVSGQPLTSEEIGYDSEDELDGSWELQMRNQGVDEYSDVTAQEKEFMKLWNAHIATFPPYGDRLLPVVCERFLQRFVDTVVHRNLRHNLLLHLINLWDFGLLLSEEVQQYLQFVDAYAAHQFQSKVGAAVPKSSSSSSSSSSSN